jgi:hypothetical protein
LWVVIEIFLGPVGREISGPQKVYGSFGNIIGFAGMDVNPGEIG